MIPFLHLLFRFSFLYSFAKNERFIIIFSFLYYSLVLSFSFFLSFFSKTFSFFSLCLSLVHKFFFCFCVSQCSFSSFIAFLFIFSPLSSIREQLFLTHARTIADYHYPLGLVTPARILCVSVCRWISPFLASALRAKHRRKKDKRRETERQTDKTLAPTTSTSSSGIK